MAGRQIRIMNLIFIYITNPNKKEAGKIARHLLEKRLIACANIFPIESLYWRRGSTGSPRGGKIVQDKEFVLIAKTAVKNFSRIKKEVEKIHPYSIPCIVKIPVEANSKYAEWLKKEIKVKIF
ncbi:MAG: divalent-cation tolerance protein CutA [bacterium]|nr:divalent-cation tolerance protein CutA [bacterium]